MKLLRNKKGQGVMGLIGLLIVVAIGFGGYWLAGIYPVQAGIALAVLVAGALSTLIFPASRDIVGNVIKGTVGSVPLIGPLVLGSLGALVIGVVVRLVMKVLPSVA
jgi:hypothetical protein